RADRAGDSLLLRPPARVEAVRAGARDLQVDLETVVGELEPVLERQLARAVSEDQPLCIRRLERGHGLVGREVAARLAVLVARLERRLAEEEVGAVRELGEPLARPA